MRLYIHSHLYTNQNIIYNMQGLGQEEYNAQNVSLEIIVIKVQISIRTKEFLLEFPK